VWRPLVVLVSSPAAVLELPRRLASAGRALASFRTFTASGLARALAEPALLREGLKPWNSGFDALLATRLIEDRKELRASEDAPLGPVARVCARTLGEIRRAGIEPHELAPALHGVGATKEDEARLKLVVELYARFDEALEGVFADPAHILRAARREIAGSPLLRGAEILVTGSPELDPLEREFVAALASALPVRFLPEEAPRGLEPGSFSAWAREHGLLPTTFPESPLRPLAPPAAPEGLARLRSRLFEAPREGPCRDASVVLMTAPGEAAEARSVVRRLLREARRGVPFEEMGILLPDAVTYAPLFTDLLERLAIPYRLHPSLPLRYGRASRALRLLFACRDLERAAVMEFVTFAPIPFEKILGEGAVAAQARWDALSRDARIVSGLDRWRVGLTEFARTEEEAIRKETREEDLAYRRRSVADARALLAVVERLAATLEELSGPASWSEWADRLLGALDLWMAGERDKPALEELIEDLRGLSAFGGDVPWKEVEEVVLSRLEWERLPIAPTSGGAIHLGALDALSGLAFRIVAIPGLGEGISPGVLRPDPLLGDHEREALRGMKVPPAGSRQLSLFREADALPPLPTTQDRLVEARRLFHRAVSQAGERLLLSYPRADPRSGRERLPSIFFAAAASAREGRPLSGADIAALVEEDEPRTLGLEEAADRSERDLLRMRSSRDARHAIAAGSLFFRQSYLASAARRGTQLTAFDGFVKGLPPELEALLDPVGRGKPVSASRLATFARCGFLYLLKYVLHVQPDPEPEERKRLEPLERGSLFHEVAEAFLREQRDQGRLPLRETQELRERLHQMGEAALEGLVQGSPPRFTLLWNREKARFHLGLDTWLTREVGARGSAPAYFEVTFGPLAHTPGEPYLEDPLAIDLGEGRVLLVEGRIDRIDRLEDGTLSIRDYKTGKAWKDDGAVYQGGKQLQMPVYILAAQKLFPETPISKAFLDFVDGGRSVSFPADVTGETFRALLRGLTDHIAKGVFVQEPSSCDFCDYTDVCGPRPLLERQRETKRNDRLVREIARIRSVR
jgi:ATP-dependent helicase/DNAse subunit B